MFLSPSARLRRALDEAPARTILALPPSAFTKQRTDDWFAARNGRVTASQAAAAIGLDKYCSRARKWRHLTGRETQEFNDFAKRAMENGQKREPTAMRLLHEALPGALVWHDVGYWTHLSTELLASPDGIAYVDGVHCAVEVKAPVHGLYARPRMSHLIQMHVQMFCMNVRHCLYACYHPDAVTREGLPLRAWLVAYDEEFMRDFMLPRIRLFRRFVQTDTEPPRMKWPRSPTLGTNDLLQMTPAQLEERLLQNCTLLYGHV